MIDPIERQYRVAEALKALAKGCESGIKVMLELLASELQEATEQVDNQSEKVC
ncbi:hypothetical protein GO013_15680 [Pseudodesulfovibrio sp. JC047]|uniref:hypothetical protein n=1 Tax=Pseudodesulfovibrio sp. JC047 TaxID=2683199 RepID=UPI0013D096A6|nr:hypothetical protein [Pseudodesulfovibrio sp. JC047]NDV20851.1 hypothetical protein [Pseudodesulfovibrio sp. JC047]